MLQISEIISQTLKERQLQKQQDYKQTSWHASSLGSCLRGNYLQRLGVKPDKEFDDRTLRKFDSGNIFEEWAINLIEKNPEVLTVLRQHRVESKIYNLSGKIDALVEYKDGTTEIIETKSSNNRAFWWMVQNGNKPSRHHEYQLWVYLKLMNINSGRIVYIEKDYLSIQEYVVVLENKELAKEVIGYLTLLNEAWSKKDITLLPLPDKKSWQSRFCRFHKQCQK